MIQFNRQVLTLAIGVILGTWLRPGVVEIVIVAATLCVVATLGRNAARGRVPAA